MNTMQANQTPESNPRAKRLRAKSRFLWLSFPALVLVAAFAFTFGTSRLKSATPVVDRSALLIETVQRGSLVRHVRGAGELIPEDTRWLAAATDAHVDRQCKDAELSTKKAEAELANLRVQLQEQLLNEHALEAQLESDATEARLQAERDEALFKQ